MRAKLESWQSRDSATESVARQIEIQPGGKELGQHLFTRTRRVVNRSVHDVGHGYSCPASVELGKG